MRYFNIKRIFCLKIEVIFIAYCGRNQTGKRFAGNFGIIAAGFLLFPGRYIPGV